MVRTRRILEIIERDHLVDHAARVGKWFLGELKTLAARHAHDMTNVRGLGLMCAFDLPNQTARDDTVRRLREERVLVLGCGERSIRFRPALNVTMPELDFGLAALDRVLS
jgi:L-lysine 6-transaminase